MSSNHKNTDSSQDGEKPHSKLTPNQAICTSRVIHRLTPFVYTTEGSGCGKSNWQDAQDTLSGIRSRLCVTGFGPFCDQDEIERIESGDLELGEKKARSHFYRVLDFRLIDRVRQSEAKKRDHRITDSHDEVDEEGSPLIHIPDSRNLERASYEANDTLLDIKSTVWGYLSPRHRAIMDASLRNPEKALDRTSLFDFMTKKERSRFLPKSENSVEGLDEKIKTAISARTKEFKKRVRTLYLKHGGKY